MRVPLLTWNVELRGKRFYEVGQAACESVMNQLGSSGEHRELFLAGERRFILTNINPAKGICNGTECVMERDGNVASSVKANVAALADGTGPSVLQIPQPDFVVVRVGNVLIPLLRNSSSAK